MRAALVALALSSCAPRTLPSPSAAEATVPAASARPTASTPPRASASATPTSEPAAKARDVALIEKMMRRVQQARGLVATKAVPGVRLPRSELIARVKEHVTRELPPEAIRNEGLALQLFGFVPTQFDYEQAEYQLLQEQLAGYYEPSDSTMYMASDLADDEAIATLAHELVHALQDQHWDLQNRSKYQAGAGDRAEAVSALAEGDATSAMFDVMIERAAPGSGKTATNIPDEVFVEQIREGVSHGPGADAPHIMRSSLAAPYIYGTLFVNALRRRGGWSEVDRAWDNSPVTSEQILHLEKWDAREPALDVGAPPYSTLGSGWHVADEDSEGELGTRIAFEEWMDAPAAARWSNGWGGDRGVLVENGDRTAFAWRLRYDAAKPKDELASKAYAALVHALDQALGPAAVRDTAFVCRERADRGPIAMALAGNDLIFALGPARTAATGWTSAGDCGLARRWVREIAGPVAARTPTARP